MIHIFELEGAALQVAVKVGRLSAGDIHSFWDYWDYCCCLSQPLQ
jgi:hypothetical protein